jgi:hypothetical protein
MPTSFAISASLKPEAKAPVSTCSGILRSVVLLRPLEALIAASIARVEAERPRHEKRFEAGEGARRAEIVVQRLHRVSGAERPDMEEVFSHGAQDRSAFLEDFPVAADHDGERAAFRLGRRARHRGIEDFYSLRAQCRRERTRRCRVGGAHVDDHRARRQRGERFQHRLAHRVTVGQHGDQRLGARGRLASGFPVAAPIPVE